MSIEDRITQKICSLCYEGDSEDEREVVEYGIALLVETAFKLLVLLIISIFVGKTWETISFIIVFCSIRTNAGGIHCQTNLGCTTSLYGIYLLGVVFDYMNISSLIVTILFALCFVICAIWSPSSTDNNPITDKKIRLTKKLMALGLLILSYLEYTFTFINLAKGAIITTYLSISVLILLLELTRKRKKQN